MEKLRVNGMLLAITAAVYFVGVSTCRHLAVDEIPLTANPTDEIGKLEGEQATALSHQADVLAPTNFSNGSASLDEARTARSKGRDTRVILDAVAEGRAYFKRAEEVAKIADTAMPAVVQARSDALKASGGKYATKEIDEVDGRLKSIATEVENDNLSSIAGEQERLVQRYQQAEILAIRTDKLAEAEKTISQSIDEGAKENAPRTLLVAQKRYQEASDYVASNPHDKQGIANRSDSATREANHLREVSRQAKVNEKGDAETDVLKVEALNARIDAEKTAGSVARMAAAEDVARQKDRAAVAEGKALALGAANQDMRSQQIGQEKLSRAKAQFTEDEADVFLDGNRLVMRLKKVAFPSGKSNLRPESLAVLGKVRQSIVELGPSKVVVEGNTDSTGSKQKNQTLSKERAEAIGQFLSTNGVPAASIQTVGYGDTRPLGPNNTVEGRAQNRRVDVTVEPVGLAH